MVDEIPQVILSDIDVEIIRALHRNAERAIDAIEAGDLKRAVILLRGQLPAEYRHTLIKPKG